MALFATFAAWIARRLGYVLGKSLAQGRVGRIGSGRAGQGRVEQDRVNGRSVCLALRSVHGGLDVLGIKGDCGFGLPTQSPIQYS